jgi:hypothetical protein
MLAVSLQAEARMPYTLLPSGGTGGKSWKPAQTNPLLDVVGEHCPEGFGADLPQATDMKAPEGKFLLQPRIDQFRHPSTLAQQGPRLECRLTRSEGAHHWILTGHHDGAPIAPVARAALSTLETRPTIRLTGAIAHHGPPRSRLLAVAGRQTFAFRADVGVGSWVVAELVRQEPFADARSRKALLGPSITFSPRAHQ